MKHLKLFNTEAEYTAYKDSEDFVLPNVSYAIDTAGVYYNPLIVESYKMVDLGLPSGLKWADRNVGAASPEDTGLYFQWGDTVGYTAEQVGEGEKTFDWSNYFDTTDGGSTFNKYATDKLTVLEAADDAATVNMGSNWRMPTKDELTELINNTTATFIDLDGNEFSQSDAENDAIAEHNFKGIKLTSKTNSNSIFVPATGYYRDTRFEYINYSGFLWSSSLGTSAPLFASNMVFHHFGTLSIGNRYRCQGISVRGVCN